LLQFGNLGPFRVQLISTRCARRWAVAWRAGTASGIVPALLVVVGQRRSAMRGPADRVAVGAARARSCVTSGGTRWSWPSRLAVCYPTA